MNTASIVSKVWSFCTTLRDDGVGYGDYLEQLTYLIFLKMADEYSKPPYSRDVGKRRTRCLIANDVPKGQIGLVDTREDRRDEVRQTLGVEVYADLDAGLYKACRPDLEAVRRPVRPKSCDCRSWRSRGRKCASESSP